MSTDTPQSQPCFVDSNIWIYAFTIDQDTEKTTTAQRLINTHTTIFLSTQVINEVCVNLLKKAAFTESEIYDLIDDFYTQYSVIEIGHDILRSASTLRIKHHVSFWDSIIVASALTSGAKLLYSEDMHDGLTIESITIVNPFRTP